MSDEHDPRRPRPRNPGPDPASARLAARPPSADAIAASGSEPRGRVERAARPRTSPRAAPRIRQRGRTVRARTVRRADAGAAPAAAATASRSGAGAGTTPAATATTKLHRVGADALRAATDRATDGIGPTAAGPAVTRPRRARRTTRPGRRGRSRPDRRGHRTPRPGEEAGLVDAVAVGGDASQDRRLPTRARAETPAGSDTANGTSGRGGGSLGRSTRTAARRRGSGGPVRRRRRRRPRAVARRWRCRSDDVVDERRSPTTTDPVARRPRRRDARAPPRPHPQGSPAGRYLMCVHVGDRTAHPHRACSRAASLVEHYVSRPQDDATSIDGNIYLGQVQNVLPGMEAAFVDIGTPEERRALPRRRRVRQGRGRGRRQAEDRAAAQERPDGHRPGHEEPDRRTRAPASPRR